MDLVLLPDQMPLDLEKHALTRADGAPDCHRSRQDRTVSFAKLDRPVLSHRHVILSRGTQRNRQKNVGVLKLSKSFCFVAIFVWSDISDQVGYFHWVPEPWNSFTIRYIRPHLRHI
jgi:uncharacterized protein (DUF2461 family)